MTHLTLQALPGFTTCQTKLYMRTISFTQDIAIIFIFLILWCITFQTFIWSSTFLTIRCTFITRSFSHTIALLTSFAFRHGLTDITVSYSTVKYTLVFDQMSLFVVFTIITSYMILITCFAKAIT